MSTFSGGKISGKHTTAIPAADPIVEEALKRPEVSKIVLGLIKAGCTRGAQGIKTVDMDAGLKCTVRGNTGVQEIYIYTTNRHATAVALHAVAPKGRGRQRKKQHNGPAPDVY